MSLSVIPDGIHGTWLLDLSNRKFSFLHILYHFTIFIYIINTLYTRQVRNDTNVFVKTFKLNPLQSVILVNGCFMEFSRRRRILI